MLRLPSGEARLERGRAYTRSNPTAQQRPHPTDSGSRLAPMTVIDPTATRSHRGDHTSPEHSWSAWRRQRAGSRYPRSARTRRPTVNAGAMPAARASLCRCIPAGCSCIPSKILSGARPPPHHVRLFPVSRPSLNQALESSSAGMG